MITTQHAARRLRRWGFTTTGLDTWHRHELVRGGDRLHITAVPARHGPAGVHRLLPPVMGSIVDLVRDGERLTRLYITGDTLDVPELDTVRTRFPGIDTMVAHLGGTRVLGVLVTLDDRQGTDLVERIDPAAVVPVHYDDYGVFRSPLSNFVVRMRERGLSGRLRTVERGDTIALAGLPVATDG